MNNMEQVRDALKKGCVGSEQIAQHTGLTRKQVKGALAAARARGHIKRPEGRVQTVFAKRTPLVWSGPVLSEWRPYPRAFA